MKTLRELAQYPSALAGLIIILGLVVVSIYALVTIPYSEAIRLWRGGEDVWYHSPLNAAPAWTHFFRREKLPETLFLTLESEYGTRSEKETADGKEIVFAFPFEFSYDTFPQELAFYLDPVYDQKQ